MKPTSRTAKRMRSARKRKAVTRKPNSMKWVQIGDKILENVATNSTALYHNLHRHMKAETLLNKLTTSMSKTEAAKLVHALGPGVVMGTKQIIDQALKDGGYKKLEPTEGDFTLLEESPTFQEDTRVGADMGCIYKKAICLTIGAKADNQMRLAAELYKPQTWPCFNSESSKYYTEGVNTYEVMKVLRSQAGSNRQGVWYPIAESHSIDTGAWRTEQKLQRAAYLSPILLRQQYYDEIRRYLMSSETINWLDDSDNKSSDIYYAINSITDVITFANAQKFLPCELKIYICKCKTRTKWWPAADWFDPTADSADYGLMRNGYIYDAGSPVSRGNPAQIGALEAVWDETSVHLGATPFYSPTFRNHWDVVDVVKQTILPTEKFELTLHRKFRHAHSIREMNMERETISEGYYCVGDYAMVITFKGLPCIMKYTGEINPGDLDTKEVDASPSRILMTSRSSMSITAPNLITPSMAPTTRGGNNYIAGEGRVLDTDLNTHAYDNTDWAPSVMTNLQEQEGGSR